LRDDLESRFAAASRSDLQNEQTRHNGNAGEWLRVLAKWDDTLSSAVQLAEPKGTLAADPELERLYADRVAVPRRLAGKPRPPALVLLAGFQTGALVGAAGKSGERVQIHLPGDPIDYSYWRNGTRGFMQTLSVTRAPADAKLLAYTAERIRAKASFASEFTAVTDVPLTADNERHRFVRDTLRDVGVDPMLEGFAV